MTLICTHGKFETSTRRGKATVSGNTVYCSIDNFRDYANYKQFFCYKYDENKVDTNNSTDNQVTTSTYTRYVKVNTSLNVRTGPGTQYDIVGNLKNNDIVTVYEVLGNWSRIGENRWVNSDYLSTTASYVQNNTVQNTTGQIKKIKACYLYSNSNLTGTKYTYKTNTTIKILKNISSTIDYVQVVQTGRKAYINNSNYTNLVITGVKKTTGQYKRLKNKTMLYKNSNLSGAKYNYLANTQVKILKNINSNIDYVYVVKTKRYAYVRNNVYK